jgi:hypothetical protein
MEMRRVRAVSQKFCNQGLTFARGAPARPSREGRPVFLDSLTLAAQMWFFKVVESLKLITCSREFKTDLVALAAKGWTSVRGSF